MARVEWTRTAPDDVEHVVAVMVLREHPSGQRIRPSQGDGGIDIVVPADDPEGVDICQVKAFSTNLGASQKAQIKVVRPSSQDIHGNGLQIRNWYLMLPLDSTRENLEWLDELTAGAVFNCEWRGLAFVDGLAAKYPDVIDYYLRDGKERLADAVADLTKLVTLGTAMEAGDSAEEGLKPSDVLPGLAALHGELNRYHPNYRYDFSVDATRPDVPISSREAPR